MTTQLLPLRPYQAEGMDAVTAAWRRGMLSPAVVLPTGAGKTVVFAHLIAAWLALNPGCRAIVLAHRTELIEQALAKINDVAPHLRTGMVKAHRNETLADVIVASVQTLRNEQRRKMLRNVGLIVVDECHHATAESYRVIFDHWPNALRVGFTATMTRSDDASLGEVWDDVVYMRRIDEMIRDGYLVRPRGLRVYVDSLDMSGVRMSKGDYRDTDLGAAIEGSLAPEAIAQAITKYCASKQTIVFCPTVKSAMVVEDAIRLEGFATGIVYGDMPPELRRATLDDFRAGTVRVLVNCMVLTEGTDLPMIECVVIARATTHVGLYIQMAGRGLRLHPGKDDCLIIDVVGASQKHALLAPVELFGEEPRFKAIKEDEDNHELVDIDDPFDDPGRGGPGPKAEEPPKTGPLAHADVDLFHGSASAWLRTYAGVWFLRAGERYIAILPGAKAGTYDVATMHKTQRNTGRWVTDPAIGVNDMSYAMAWAEGEVTSAERTTASRDRSWRAKKATEPAKALARKFGLKITDDMNAGEVGGMITVHLASARIDPGLKVLTHG